MQAQVQWNAKGLTQYGGLKPDNSQCRRSDIVTGYNVTLEEAVELKNFCVEYAQPTALALPSVEELPETTTTTTTSSSQVTTLPRTRTRRGDTSTHSSDQITIQSSETTTSASSATASSQTTSSTTSAAGSQSTTNSNAENVHSSSTPTSSTTTTSCTGKSSEPTGSVTKNRKRYRDDTDPLFVKPPTTRIRRYSQTPIATPESEVTHLCPEKITDAWLKMQGGNIEELRKKSDKLDIKCKKMVEDIRRGKKIKPVPEVVEAYRPPVAPVYKTPLIPASRRVRGMSNSESGSAKGKSKGKAPKSRGGKSDRGGKSKRPKGIHDSHGKAYAEAENGSMITTPLVAMVVLILMMTA